MSDYKFIDDIIDKEQINNIVNDEYIKYILLGFLIFMIICAYVVVYINNYIKHYHNKIKQPLQIT